MKKSTLFVILVLGLFLIACSTQEQRLKEDPGVKLFYAMNDNVKYAETSFSGESAKAISELAKTECPQGVGDEFTRSTFTTDALTLTIYSSKKNITCYVTKLNKVNTIVERKKTEAPDENTLVTVNGKSITKDALQRAVATLPAGSKVDLNAELQLLNNLVDQELLRQEQEKMTVTSDEVGKVRENLLLQLKVTEDELPALLEKQKIDKTNFDKELESQAKLEKLLSKRLLTTEIEITDETAKAYYLQNPNQFLIADQAIMRHIFLKGTPDEYAKTAQIIEAKLNSTDFCELVRQYSADESSKSQCGIYTIPRGVIDPNLERAAFSTPANTTTVVKTSDGLHFVQSLQVTQSQVVPYNQVSGTLQTNLKNALFQQRLNLYLTTLRAESKIETFLG